VSDASTDLERADGLAPALHILVWAAVTLAVCTSLFYAAGFLDRVLGPGNRPEATAQVQSGVEGETAAALSEPRQRARTAVDFPLVPELPSFALENRGEAASAPEPSDLEILGAQSAAVASDNASRNPSLEALVPADVVGEQTAGAIADVGSGAVTVPDTLASGAIELPGIGGAAASTSSEIGTTDEAPRPNASNSGASSTGSASVPPTSPSAGAPANEGSAGQPELAGGMPSAPSSSSGVAGGNQPGGILLPSNVFIATTSAVAPELTPTPGPTSRPMLAVAPSPPATTLPTRSSTAQPAQPPASVAPPILSTATPTPRRPTGAPDQALTAVAKK